MCSSMDCFEVFSTFFHDKRVFLNGKEYPLGQVTVDVLNLNEQLLDDLELRVTTMIPPVMEFLRHPSKAFANDAQPKMDAVWDLVFALPLYRDLAIDKEPYYHCFAMLLADPEKLSIIRDPTSEQFTGFIQVLDELANLAPGLRLFRKQITFILQQYLEPVKRRNADTYARAYTQFHSDLINSAIKHSKEVSWGQNFPVEVSFVPMAYETDSDKVILAEKANFTSMLHFLPTEFYRALMVGNAPRCCHNCGRYFLLTTGYNTCYCNNIAPGETERTCRMVGAHRKEAQGKANRTPAQKEYAKTYNRLKQRKQRRKISTDEWNAAVAKAQELVDRSGRGELSDEELKQRLEEL